jgi:hypothetical protein
LMKVIHGISTFRGILIEWSDELEEPPELSQINHEFDWPEFDESHSQNAKHDDQQFQRYVELRLFQVTKNEVKWSNSNQ